MNPRPIFPAPNCTAVGILQLRFRQEWKSGRVEERTGSSTRPLSGSSSIYIENASGRSLHRGNRRIWPAGLAQMISQSAPPSSAIHWRQAPHGAAGGELSVTTTTTLILLAPFATADAMAVRSAHSESP